MSKVVYIFGAGASIKSLPIVDEIGLFFELFVDWTRWHLDNIKPHTAVNREDFKPFFEFANNQIQESKQYPSPDTYARVLKLKNDDDNYKKFNSFVSLFFLWKESILLYKYGDQIVDDVLKYKKLISFEGGSIPVETKEINEKLFKIQEEQINKKETRDKIKYSIDPRYFGFLSTILDNSNDRKMPEEIGIISWNFDTQLERSFIELNTKINDNNYIKLNGNVMFFRGDKKELMGDDFYKIKTPNDLIKLIGNFSDLESNIRYSWDHAENEQDGKLVNLAAGMEKIIVIGYSFPVYNRITDTYIFKKLREEIERVGAVNVRFEIVGRSEDTFKKQKSSFVSILQNAGWSFSDNSDYIKFRNSPDQFPIPREIRILGK